MERPSPLSCMLSVIFLALLCKTASAHDAVEGSAAHSELLGQVDQLLEKWNRSDSPGCVVGIVRGGKLIYSKGVGTSNLEYEVANTPQTVFDVASFAKSLTCACLALLMDEGKIRPEDELGKFVPEMQPFDPPIRIQDLVRCRSGIWDQVSVPILVGWENAPQQFPYREADFFDLLAGQKTLPFPPGTEFRYSSGDYFLLGVIIKRVSGQSPAEFARERIFGPLGMERTFFEVDPTRVVRERAVGHYKQGDAAWRLWRPTTYWAGGGGLKTCVEDLYRWDQNFARNRLPAGKYLDELLNEGSLLGNRYCLDADAYRKETDPEARRDSPPGQYRGLKRRQFTGGAWGFTAAMSQFSDHALTVICLSNCDEVVAWTMNSRIADLLLVDQFPIEPKPVSPPASELPTVSVAESDLQEKVGAYRMNQTGQIWQITLKDGVLHVTDHLRGTHPLRPLSPTRFDPEGPFYASTRFVFKRPTADSAPAFTSEWDEPSSRGKLEFEPVRLVDPNPSELTQYAGEYVSTELAATYRMEVRDSRLWLRINSRRWEPLEPTVRAEFVPQIKEPTDGRILRFIRADTGDVSGLTVDYFRVNGVTFAKR